MVAKQSKTKQNKTKPNKQTHKQTTFENIDSSLEKQTNKLCARRSESKCTVITSTHMASMLLPIPEEHALREDTGGGVLGFFSQEELILAGLQRDKMEVDIEPGDPTGDMHEAESGYVHEDPDRPQHRVSADLLHDIVHREKELKAHAQKIDEPGRTAELSKTLDQFYSMHFPVYESLKQKTGQQAQSALSTALPGQAFASKAGAESAMQQQERALSAIADGKSNAASTPSTSEDPHGVREAVEAPDGSAPVVVGRDQSLPGAPKDCALLWVERATLNHEQIRACAPIICAVQHMWENRSDEGSLLADGAPPEPVVVMWLGAGGSGKTWAYTEVIRPLLLRYFGSEGVLAMAPTHQAARLLGKEALTLHKAAGAAFRQTWDKEAMLLKGRTLKEQQERWGPLRATVIDEISLAVPEVYHGIALRSTYARQQTHKLNVADYMQKWFGHMPLGLHLGDFLQLRPAGRRSIAERLEPKKEAEQEAPEEDAAEDLKEEDTPAELGREAFHAGVNFVSLFTGTGRFSTCESGQKLVQILECMRLGRQMPRELWDELQKRQLVEKLAESPARRLLLVLDDG